MESRFLAPVLAASLLATGCGPADSAPEQPVPGSTTTAAACTPELADGYSPGAALPADSMKLTYHETKDANPDFAKIQETIGSTAVSVALTESFCVRIGGTVFKAALALPAETEARTQAVVITGDSTNAGKIFDQIGLGSNNTDTVSTTRYQVAPGADGVLHRTGPAVSVVGQETTGAGAFQNIATERCQALDLTTTPPLHAGDATTYDTIKESVCNAVGSAVDRVILHEPYGKYVQEFQGKPLPDNVNKTGNAYDAVVSSNQYALLMERLPKP